MPGWLARTGTALALALFLARHAQAVPAPPPEVAAIAKAMESEGITHRIVGEEEDQVVASWTPKRYRDLNGDADVTVVLSVNRSDGDAWAVASAYEIYSLFDCEHPSAARRVLMGAPDKLGLLPVFLYDESDGTVTARMGVPMPDGTLDGETLKTLLHHIVASIDKVDPVLRRAMRTGMVDWPADDLGPQEPTGWIEVKGADRAPVRVGWAPWPERSAWASTLVAADGILRKLCTWNDEERDAFGRRLAGDFRGSRARSIFVDWLRGAQYVEQRYPPVAVRFWGPEGTTVAASVRCAGFCRGTATDRRVIDAMGHVDVKPMVNWNNEALLALDQPADAEFEVTVTAGDTEATGTASVRIQPPNISELGLPAALPVAVHVNEMHPWVKPLVAEAARLRIAESMGADERTSHADAVRQLYAVWRVFRDRDLKYVSLHEATDAAGAQPIRPLHEAIADEGANCADGTAALASVLRALGFDVHFARIPGHVLLGVHRPDDDPRREWIFLETTALGDDAVLGPVECFDEDVESTVPEAWRDAEWDCFEEACRTGLAQVDAAESDGTLVITSLRDLRDAGLRPIPAPKSKVGELPPPPPAAPITERRASARAALEAEVAALRAWLETLPNERPVGYERAEDIAHDLEVVCTDLDALGRLLRAVDGDEVGHRCMRATAELHDAMRPYRKAADDAFGGHGNEAGSALRIPEGGHRVEVHRKDAERAAIQVHAASGDMRTLFGVHLVDGRYFIDGDFLAKCHGEVLDQTTDFAMLFRAGTFREGDAMEALARGFADRIRAGKFADRDAATDAMAADVLGRFWRDREETTVTEEPGTKEGPR